MHDNAVSNELKRASVPPVGFGLASIVLGAISLVLFIVPVLGIPIGVCGIVVGLVGVIAALLGKRADMRLCAAGLMLSGVAIMVLGSIALAPSGYFSPGPVFPEMLPVQGQAYVSPPAPPPSARVNYETWRIQRVSK